LPDDSVAGEYLSDDIIYGEQYLDDDAAGKSPKIKIRRLRRPFGRRHIIYATLIVVGVFFAAAALRMVLSDVIEDAAARDEYSQLRDEFPHLSAQNPGQGTGQNPGQPTIDDPGSEDNGDVIEETDEELAQRMLSLDELASINRDFVGWISANNGVIDYPVVRGNDNVKYINTTFSGAHNSAGTIFMDYRHTGGFDDSVAILFGHRTRDNAMFSSLVNQLNPDFRSRNQDISIITRDGRRLTYYIFAVKLTDAWDPAYSVGAHDLERASEIFPNAPANAIRYLLLSTCTASSNDDERILVFAALY